MSISAALERDTRRINLKHLFLQYNPSFSAAVYLFVLICCWTLERHAGAKLALAPRVVVAFMALSGLFRAFGGHISRREPADQAKQLRDMALDVVMSFVYCITSRPWACAFAVTLLAELSKITSPTLLAAGAAGVLWVAPRFNSRSSFKVL